MQLPFRRKKSEDSSQLGSLLELAQRGDPRARNQIIEQYTPFVLRIASQAAKRYISRDADDEFSVALLALNEAIDHYDPHRNASFLSFAETIIRRRLIDYFRAQKAQQHHIPWTEFDVTDEEDHVINYAEVATSLRLYAQEETEAARRQEVAEFNQLLQSFGLSFAELVEVSPKHQDARQTAITVARTIVADEQMMRYVRERKALPLKMLEGKVPLSRKSLERQRKYILAMVLLLTGDFPHLQSYISGE